MTTPRDWDAATYDRVADPQTRWGAAVLDRLPLAGDETRPRRRLRQRPGHRARSPSACRAAASSRSTARRRWSRPRARGSRRFGDRVDYVVADLGRPLPLAGGPVDAILSTATFHWVPDHDALFRNLAAVLRPGGRLVAQCGGAGNIASVKAVLATIGDGWLGAVHFETPMATPPARSRRASSTSECWLQPRADPVRAGEPFETFLRTVDPRRRTSTGCRPRSATRSSTRSPSGSAEPVIDYVRLNIVATRG